jgi:hypothetical protein
MEVSDQLHAKAEFASGERSYGTYWIVGWMGPGAYLDAVKMRKIYKIKLYITLF